MASKKLSSANKASKKLSSTNKTSWVMIAFITLLLVVTIFNIIGGCNGRGSVGSSVYESTEGCTMWKDASGNMNIIIRSP